MRFVRFSIQMPKPTVESSTTQAEEMRQQRNEEAKQLIGNSVDKAKAIFNQNTAAGQLAKAAKTAPVKPVRNSITRSTTGPRQQHSPDRDSSPQQSEQSISPVDTQPSNNNLPESTIADQTADNLEDDDSNPYSTIKRSPYSKSNSQNEPSANDKQTDNVQTKAEPVRDTSVEQLTTEPQPVAVDPGETKIQMTECF